MISENQKLNLGIEKIENGTAWFNSLPRQYSEKLHLDSKISFIIRQNGTEVIGSFTQYNLAFINNIAKQQSLATNKFFKQYFSYTKQSNAAQIITNAVLTKEKLTTCRNILKSYNEEHQTKTYNCAIVSIVMEEQFAIYKESFKENSNKLSTLTENRQTKLVELEESIEEDIQYIRFWFDNLYK